MTLALEARDVSVRFGGLQALDSVEIEVGEWEIVGLIGPNGAGKTTFLDVLTGVARPDRGTVRLRGANVSRLPAHRRVQMGMARTWQHLGLVSTLTVLDNLLAAQHGHVRYSAIGGIVGLPGTLLEERELVRNAEEILHFLGLPELRDERAGDLPSGIQKLCDMAMALATDPTVLLLDEASSGMSQDEARRLGQILAFLRSELNLTIVMSEHRAPLVMDTCDFVYVLNAGRLLARGEPATIRNHPDLVAAYLGEEVDGATA
jgi:branched-chain amino acid transport system ATP-binding protein